MRNMPAFGDYNHSRDLKVFPVHFSLENPFATLKTRVFTSASYRLLMNKLRYFVDFSRQKV